MIEHMREEGFNVGGERDEKALVDEICKAAAGTV
jgi:hypothetical protein